MNDGPTLCPGSAFTGHTAYIVPESAQSFLLHDNGNYIAFQGPGHVGTTRDRGLA